MRTFEINKWNKTDSNRMRTARLPIYGWDGRGYGPGGRVPGGGYSPGGVVLGGYGPATPL